ncbi:hypothetical protein GGR54DRAFT_650460 [Hypoxylon sp. NC1633]|nr:hypothetical protein GGR54DRAFT_650460 [Hypoxylon sp. NC1633]
MSDYLTSFTLFGMLPPEIRILIWECAMDMPRLIHLPYDKSNGPRVKIFKGKQGYRPFLTIDGKVCQQIPIFFLVNYESRELALKRYTNQFFTKQHNWNQSCQFPEVPVARFIASDNDVVVSNRNWYWRETPMIRNMAFHDKSHIEDKLQPLHSLRSELAATKDKSTCVRGHQKRLRRCARYFENRISQLETDIEVDLKDQLRKCIFWRESRGLQNIERWIVILKRSDEEISVFQYSDLVFVDRTKLMPDFWKRLEENKNNGDLQAWKMAMEAEKLEFARFRQRK